MDWDKLRVFHTVAESNSFTQAAERLNLSQSAISRQISALEQDIGVSLFHRHARGLVPTEQGETLYNTVHDILLKLDQVRSKLTESTKKPEGKLKVTTTVGLGTSWLVHRVHEFMELYPQIELQLILENEELDLTQREADCAIRLRLPTQSDLIQRRLFTVHVHIYASTTYIARHGQPNTLADLDNHSIISFGENAPAYLTDINWLETAGRPSHQPRRAICQVNNLLGVRSLCENGAGIAVLPEYMLNKNSPLVQLLTNIEAPSFETYFVYPAESRSSAKIQAFRDFLITSARSWDY